MKERLIDLLSKSDDKVFKISIALPTHRFTNESKQDLILYGNLLKEVKTKLEEKYERCSWEKTFEKLEELKNKNEFWEHLSDGLLILASENLLEEFLFDYPVNAHAVVGEYFHIQPLFISNFQIDTYYLVDLKKDRAVLYQANDKEIEEIRPEDIKLNFDELFTDTDSNSNYNSTTFSGIGNTAHGHRSKSEEEDKYREKFYRYLNKKFKQLYAKMGYKFILAGTIDNIKMFRQYNQEDFYSDREISKPVSPLSKNELLSEVRTVTRPSKELIIKKVNEDINVARGVGKYIHDCNEISEAINEARVAKLIITEENGDHCDKIDYYINKAFRSKSEIVVLKENYGLESKVVAILRY